VKLNEAESLEIFVRRWRCRRDVSRRRVIIRRLMGSGMAVTELGWENGPPEKQDPTSGLHRLADARRRLSENGAILVIILRWLRRHRASPDHVHVIGPVKIAHARLNVSFQQYHSTSSFVRPADCSLPTRYLLYHIAATNGPHRAIIE